MIPILLVEHEQDPIDRLELLLKRCAANGHQTAITTISDYTDAMAKIQLGTFPVYIIDLQLPDVHAGASRDANLFLGLELIAAAKQNNPHAIVCAYTGYAGQAVDGLVKWHVDYILNKHSTDDELKPQLEQALLKATERFNLTIDPCVREALNFAFQGLPPLGTTEQWEICLRRSLRRAEHSVVYNRVGSGRSGAGLLAMYVDDQLPKVIKLHQHEELENELERYDQYVKDFIPRRSQTGQDDLTLAGGIGCLVYSFVGLVHHPKTFGQAIEDVPVHELITAVNEHFKTNCERWFSNRGTPKPYDLAEKCKTHFAPDPSDIRIKSTASVAATAIEYASRHVRDCTGNQLIDAICNAITVNRRRIHCNAEAIIHGDLNANNLILDQGHLWMIDFAKTCYGPRLLDFVKLEASVKFDIMTPIRGRLREDDLLEASMAIEDVLVRNYVPSDTTLSDTIPDSIKKKLMVIAAIRNASTGETGPEGEIEYRTALFFVTAKHVQYLLGDLVDDPSKYIPLVHALVSAYSLARSLESTLIR